MLAYRYKACEPDIKEQVVGMAINGSGIRDTARVFKINKNTVISPLKKSSSIVQVNPNFQALNSAANLTVRLELAWDKAEMDKPWSFVATNLINVGSGMPSIRPRTQYWLICFAKMQG